MSPLTLSEKPSEPLTKLALARSCPHVHYYSSCCAHVVQVHAGELRYVLTGIGEDKLTNDEVDEILKEVGTDSEGFIDYEQLLENFVL